METLRACNSEEVQSDRDTAQLMSFYNEEVSLKLSQLPKYQAFKQWCDTNGILYPGVEFPAAFGTKGQLIGMAAAKDVPPSTAFLYVPQELQINKHTIKNRAPELWEVQEKHPEVFKKHYDAEYLRLIVYVYYELLKGEQSFYHPYFEVISDTDLPMTWSDEEL